MKYTVYYLVGMLLGLSILVVWQAPKLELRIVACDVGQGDAILIIKGSNQVLVDGGPSGEKVLGCLERHTPFYDRTIELVVLTNTDFDHMNGLSTVVSRYEVLKLVSADGVHESDALRRFRDALVEQEIEVVGVEQGDTITIGSQGEMKFEVLWPPDNNQEFLGVFGDELAEARYAEVLGESSDRGDLNERSVVLLLSQGENKALFTGDIGFEAERALVASKMLSRIEYLKVGHHGSKYASSTEFLEMLKPAIAVISAGQSNRYGHPTPEAIERLKQVDAVVHRTDEEGDVVVQLEE